jgi:hypothetical protein
MANASRTLHMCLMAVGVIVPVLRPAGVAAQERPKITIAVYNRSKTRTSIVTAGQSVAQEVLRRASVESIWINCPVPNTPEANPECSQPPNPSRLNLTIVPRWAGRALTSDTLGLALEGEGFGSYCYLFQERVDELAAAAHISPDRLLGSAMAHEIGHLLKGSNSHSPQGLMSAHWYANELRNVAMGSLNFTADDAVLMRSRLVPSEDQK